MDKSNLVKIEEEEEEEDHVQKITPFLWFDRQAEEAAGFLKTQELADLLDMEKKDMTSTRWKREQ